MSKVLLHPYTAERDLDNVECECFVLCASAAASFQTVCAATEIPGLHEVNKTFLGRFFFFHIL